MLKAIRSVVRFRKPTLDLTESRLAKSPSIADLRRLAQRRLPRGVFDYIDGGAEDEVTLRENVDAYRRLQFQARVLADVSEVDTSTTLIGKRMSAPVVLAPTGFTRIAAPAGELAVAKAATRVGIPYTLSTLATRSIEEVAAVARGRLWFQVYVWKDRGLVKELIDRASQAGYEALCLTVDTAVLGKRERDKRRGFTLPPKIGVGTILDGLLHPGWTWDFIRAEPISFANVRGRSVGDGTDAVSLSDYITSQFDPSVSWADIDWFRHQWDGPLVLKGIQSAEDAVRATSIGVDVLALSNHGGRQLDSAVPTIELLPEVVDAVSDSVDLICDGGVRRGSDVIKALALGAKAVMVGRPYLYGLGAAGERGVDHALEILISELERSMALLGRTSVRSIDRELIRELDTMGHRG